jgi:RNA polymerase sigma factor (sigma-70 family)
MSSNAVNPLLDPAPESWDRLIEAVGPASLLLCIESRMSDGMRSRWAPEDVFQDVLLRAWRARSSIEWRGQRAFRGWLLTLADRCIKDLADHDGAAKRCHHVTSVEAGAGAPAVFSLGAADFHSGTSYFAGPAATTTPSRAASLREATDTLRDALSAVPDDVRDVVRLRLIEQQSLSAIASTLGLTIATVRSRLRRGAEDLERKLRAASVGTRPGGAGA